MPKIRGVPAGWGQHWMWACVLLTWCLLPAVAHAQGSIYGTVQNADLTNPPVTDLYWVGFLDDTDEEVRIELNTGAGYDGTNWFDDFQNYTTRVAGNPYDFYFVNVVNGQGFHLAKTIPSNSFQQENILLAPMTFPARPAGLVTRVASVSRINLSWNYQTGVTYHVYRRATANNGTFRRLDSPTGLLTNPGVADSFFVDATSDGLSDYTYIIIGQNPAGNFSAHSLTVSALASAPAAPTVTGVTPDSGSAAGGIVVTIKGTNFDVAGASVTFGANPATGVTVQSPFALTCTVPSSGFVGAVNVVVTNTASGLASAPLLNGFRYLGNSAPVLDLIGPKSVAEGAALSLRLHATDPDLTIPVLSAVGVPLHATFVDSLNGAGSLVFNPDYTQAGVFNVTFIATDGSLADSEVVAITVTNTNRPPVLDAIGAKSVAEGANLSFRTHASDPDGNIPTLSAVGVPLNATFVDSLNGSGSLVFKPDYSQSGVFNVTFIAGDGSLADSEVVAITVTNTNRPPVLDPIGARSVAEAATLSFRTHASDPDGAIPALTVVGAPPNSTFVDSLNGSASFVFNPDYTQSGVYNVTFIASDGLLADTEIVAITVTNTNRPPVLDPIGAKSVAEGATLSFRTHATDPDGAIPVLSAVGVPLHATFVDSLNGSGSLVFNPDNTQSGIYNVTVIASDGSLADTEIVAITVTNTNRSPLLDLIGAKSVAEGANLTFRTHATDPDGAIPALTAVGVPLNATFVDSLNGSGAFVFNPDYSQASVFNVTFIASDGSLADTEIVAITVTNTNQAPILDPIGAKSVTEATTLTFRTHAIDPDGPIPVLTAVNVPLNAAFVDSGNGAGSFVFNPNFTQAGPYSVTFIASDGSLADSEVVSITVNDSGNQRPVLDLIGAKAVAEAGNLSFRTHATDPDGTIPSLLAVGLPANSAFVDSLNGAGGFVFNPDYTQAGVYNVTFITSDGLLADSEIVAITVTNTNRPPVLDPIGPQSVAEGASLSFRTSASDLDGTIPVLSAVGLPANAGFVDSANGSGSLLFNPDFTQAGVYNVTFVAGDGSLADSEIVAITVTGVNRPPVLAPIGPKVVSEGSALLVHVTATDPDLTIPVISAVGLPLNATFTDSLNGRGGFVFTPNFVQSGAYLVTFIASDGVAADSEVVVITVVDQGNLAPVFDSVAPQVLFEGDTLELRVHAVDPEGGPVILGLSQPLKNGAFVDSGNGFGLLRLIPDYYQAGIDTARILAIDNGIPLASKMLKIALTIQEKNLPPILNPIGSRTVLANDSLKIRIVATDSTAPPGGLLFMSALNLPANATFQDSGHGIGKFRFLPTFPQIGSYNVTFVVTDNGTPALAALETITITVQNTNRPPVLAYISPKTLNEIDTVSFNVYATDPDGTIPFLRVDSIPKNATFVDSGNGVGTFTFRPNYIQSGLYNVKFTASDGLASVSQQVLIQVNDAGNQAPILGPIGPLAVMEKSTLTVLIGASDPDFTILVLDVDTLIENATFFDSGNGVGVFRITPQYWQDSVYTLIFTASDGTLADSEVVTLTVMDIGNQLPLFAPFTQPIVQESQILRLTVAVVDSDLTVPSLVARPLPAWAAFVDSANGKGTFTFAPGYSDSGIYTIYVVANDTDTPGARDSARVSVRVTDKNRLPVISATSWGTDSGIRLLPGETGTVWLHATDPDGSIPRVVVTTTIQPHMTFADSGNGSAIVSFTPDFTQVLTYNVTFRAIDRFYTADSSGPATVAFIVGTRNVAPVLDPIGPRSTVEGNTLQFLVTASDSNGTTPVIEAFSMPANASLVSISAGQSRFTFLPSYIQAGIYSVLFRARDGQGLVDSERVAITVIEAGNQRPRWTSLFPIDTVGLSVYGTYSLHVRATDADNPILTLSVLNRPRNATFVDSGNSGGLFAFAPDPTQADSVYNVRFVASDGSLADTAKVIFKMIAFDRGDVNMDGEYDVFDVIYLIEYTFSGGPAPLPVLESGDVALLDKDQVIIDVFDLLYLIDYVFSGGPAPPP